MHQRAMAVVNGKSKRKKRKKNISSALTQPKEEHFNHETFSSTKLMWKGRMEKMQQKKQRKTCLANKEKAFSRGALMQSILRPEWCSIPGFARVQTHAHIHKHRGEKFLPIHVQDNKEYKGLGTTLCSVCRMITFPSWVAMKGPSRDAGSGQLAYFIMLRSIRERMVQANLLHFSL